ncbi:MAG: hypothetical protein HY937_04465 [Nitrosomonadales bacterium]|nr:hypothetical protein [Nitrosomonadales bacterium]
MTIMQSEDITNDLAGVFCRVSQMASSFIRKQKTEDRSAVAAVPCHLYDRAALRRTTHQSSVLGPQSSERGSTLIVSLIILILVMLLGVTAMTTSDTQYKLAGNLQFENAAMNNTETAISTAENWLATGTNFSNAGFTTYDPAIPHLYPIGAAGDPLTMTWSDGNSIQVANTNQRYIIELMSVGNILGGSSVLIGGVPVSICNKVNTYRITARGVSARGATKFVQSYYSVLNCPPT